MCILCIICAGLHIGKREFVCLSLERLSQHFWNKNKWSWNIWQFCCYIFKRQRKCKLWFYLYDLTQRYIFVSKFGEVFVYRALVKANSLLSNCYKTKNASKVTSLMESCYVFHSLLIFTGCYWFLLFKDWRFLCVWCVFLTDFLAIQEFQMLLVCQKNLVKTVSHPHKCMCQRCTFILLFVNSYFALMNKIYWDIIINTYVHFYSCIFNIVLTPYIDVWVWKSVLTVSKTHVDTLPDFCL